MQGGHYDKDPIPPKPDPPFPPTPKGEDVPPPPMGKKTIVTKGEKEVEEASKIHSRTQRKWKTFRNQFPKTSTSKLWQKAKKEFDFDDFYQLLEEELGLKNIAFKHDEEVLNTIDFVTSPISEDAIKEITTQINKIDSYVRGNEAKSRMIIDAVLVAVLHEAKQDDEEMKHMLDLEARHADYAVKGCFVVEAKANIDINAESAQLQTLAYMIDHDTPVGVRTDGETWEVLLLHNQFEKYIFIHKVSLELICSILYSSLCGRLDEYIHAAFTTAKMK